MYSIGIDIGGTSVKLGLFTLDGELMKKWEIPTRKEEKGAYILEDVSKSVDQVLVECMIDKEELTGIGVGVPGPITSDGTVLRCANLGWDVFSVADELRRLTQVENIRVGNDANVAALGEMWQGGGRGYENMVMVTLGTGVGGGVIVNGDIVTGFQGAGGEVGHMTVEPSEPEICGCGNHGCLEQYASATGVVRLARKHLQNGEASSLADREEYLSAKMVFDAAKMGDTLALEVVEEFGRYLGIALSNVANVVDPQAFVIGGGVSRAGEMILDVVRKYYNQFSMFALKDKVFRLAELGNDAGIYGSAKMVV